MPVSTQCYGCCPVVVDRCSMLCHTQCSHSLAWGEQWPSTTPEVCLCLLPTSNERPCILSWMRGTCSTTAPGTSLTPPLAEVCFQSSQSWASEPRIGVQLNSWLCTCGLQTWNHSLSPTPVWHLLSVADVSLWRPMSAHVNRLPGHQQRVLWSCPWQYRGQLINLQSKTCHNQATTSWNTFLFVEFARECRPYSDSDSPVTEIFWHTNRQSASEANLVKVSDDTILPICLIGFLQVKEESDCLLPLGKRIPEISFKTH